MCGLYGYYVTTNSKVLPGYRHSLDKFIRQAAKTSILRGVDGTGLWKTDYNNGILTYKKDVDAIEFDREGGISKLLNATITSQENNVTTHTPVMPMAVGGHVRATTSGGNSSENCHPHLYTTKGRTVCAVHNGTLNGTSYYKGDHHAVDSARMVRHMTDIGVREALEKDVIGAYALAVLERDAENNYTAYLVRNGARPLAICPIEEGAAGYLYMSEADHLDWLINRTNSNLKDLLDLGEVRELKVGEVVACTDQAVWLEDWKLHDTTGKKYNTNHYAKGYSDPWDGYSVMGVRQKTGWRNKLPAPPTNKGTVLYDTPDYSPGDMVLVSMSYGNTPNTIVNTKRLVLDSQEWDQGKLSTKCYLELDEMDPVLEWAINNPRKGNLATYVHKGYPQEDFHSIYYAILDAKDANGHYPIQAMRCIDPLELDRSSYRNQIMEWRASDVAISIRDNLKQQAGFGGSIVLVPDVEDEITPAQESELSEEMLDEVEYESNDYGDLLITATGENVYVSDDTKKEMLEGCIICNTPITMLDFVEEGMYELNQYPEKLAHSTCYAAMMKECTGTKH